MPEPVVRHPVGDDDSGIIAGAGWGWLVVPQRRSPYEACGGDNPGFALELGVNSSVLVREADHFSGIQPETPGKLIDGADGDL